LPSATTGAAVKQGWNTEFGQANVNTTGFVNRDRYAVVIMSSGATSTYLDPITDMLTHTARLLLPNGRFPAPPPAITKVSPTTLPTRGGWHVVVRGSDLTRVLKVVFGTRATTRFSSVSARELTVVAPSHSAGRVQLRVVTSHGISRRTAADVVRYVSTPIIGSTGSG
jgi:hypothetical protein